MPQSPQDDEMKYQAVQEAEERMKAQKAIAPGKKRPSSHTAEGLTEERLRALTPLYVDIGPKPAGIGVRRWKWSWRKHVERKKLRKDLKKNYQVKKWREFEEIAREVGLGLDNPVLLGLLRFGNFLFGAGGILSVLGAAVLVMMGLFAWSFIQESVGSFTIQLNPKTMQNGFVLSETPDFEHKTARLKSDELMKVNAVSMDDIKKDVDVEADGAHNGKFYIAYTFYIRNEGDSPQGYEYNLILEESTQKLESAVWIMLYEDGHQIMYTMPNTRPTEGSTGEETTGKRPERLAGYGRPPFFETAYSCTDQYYFYCKDGGGYVTDSDGAKVRFTMDLDGNIEIAEGNVPDNEREDMIRNADTKWTKEWGVCSTAAVDDTIMVYGIVENVEPMEYHKYTVVIWVEGDDADCTDELFGGFGKYYIEFDPIDDGKRSLFDTVYRKEYDVSRMVEKTKQENPDEDPQTQSDDGTSD